jgi:putative transposase
MAYDPQKHHRRSIRLKGYDYTRPGAYFVTICTHDRSNVLGEIVNGKMQLSPIGQVAHDFWGWVSDHFSNVEVTPFIVMPNHVHAIITIYEHSRTGVVSSPPEGDTAPEGGRGVVSTPHGVNAAPEGGRDVVSTPHEGYAAAGGRETLPLPDLRQIIGYYKYQTTKQINAKFGNPGMRFWQRNYYERVVRDQEELRRFSEYILSNPQRWETDLLHPSSPSNQINQKSS